MTETSSGGIELERSLDSIVVGRRHREDLGDLDQLVASIERDGLLQPITVTIDGVLVCGARRLAALRRLGVKTTNVWVRSGISGRLGQILAEQDDNTLHKPLTPTEQATLYRELKALLAEDAARRQEASRFTAEGQNPRSDGGGTVTAPSDTPVGRAREQAARMVTGRDSHSSLERIGELQALTADPTRSADIRERAAIELEGIDAGGSITGARQRIHASLDLAELDTLAADHSQPDGVRHAAATGAARVRELEATARAAELEQLAAQALARAKAATKKRKTTAPKPRTSIEDGVASLLPLRSFVFLWNDLDEWWERYDPAEVGPALTDAQWERFDATIAGTIAFAEAAQTARRKANIRPA